MAYFPIALALVLLNEGNYGNDPSDPGGETYKGISRRNWPKWIGWYTIDLLKPNPLFPSILESNTELREEVELFYEVSFWNTINGSLINEQAVANSIFDFAVNAGAKSSVSLAQLVVDATPDGIAGSDTLDKINKSDTGYFLSAFTIAKIARYVAIVKKRPSSRKYFFGWICRALEMKTECHT